MSADAIYSRDEMRNLARSARLVLAMLLDDSDAFGAVVSAAGYLRS